MPTTIPERALPKTEDLDFWQSAAKLAIAIGLVSGAFFILFATGAYLTPESGEIFQIFVG
jgi:hypothetical protein